jgi:hypothetical protein
MYSVSFIVVLSFIKKPLGGIDIHKISRLYETSQAAKLLGVGLGGSKNTANVTSRYFFFIFNSSPSYRISYVTVTLETISCSPVGISGAGAA